jgi:hypothetical protein
MATVLGRGVHVGERLVDQLRHLRGRA